MNAPKGNGPVVLVVGLIGLGGWWWFSRQGGAGQAAAAPPDPIQPIQPIQPASGGFLDNLTSGLGAGVGNFFGGIGAGLGSAVGQLLESQGLDDPDSDARQGLHKFGDTLKSALHVTTFGLVGDPTKTRDKHRAFSALLEHELEEMERFAGRVHQALSRSDVSQWVLDSGGNTGNGATGNSRFSIYYTGQAQPYVIEVPPAFAHVRLAFAAEPIVRALGTFVQRGHRIGVPFTSHTPPAYDDRNPYAPSLQTVSARKSKAVNDELDKAQKVGKRLKNKDIQRALGAQQGDSPEEE